MSGWDAHEAAHAVCAVAEGRKLISATIKPPKGSSALGVHGFVRVGDDADDVDDAMILDGLRAEREALEKSGSRRRDPLLREAEPADNAFLGMLGAFYYAGVAAQYPLDGADDFVSPAAWTASIGDRSQFSKRAAASGIWWPPERWSVPAWIKACEIVDAHWGEVIEVAAALREHGTLSGAQAVKIMKRASARRNRRPVWSALAGTPAGSFLTSCEAGGRRRLGLNRARHPWGFVR